MYKPTNTYTIPAAPVGGFSRLKVEDQFQREYILDGRYDTYKREAREVAECVVRSSSKFKIGADGRMGIYVHDIEDPTDEQILNGHQHAIAVRENDELMHGIVNDARQLFAEGQPLQRYHHMAAKFLRITGEKWQDRNTKREATKECPFCAAILMASVVKCGTCNEIVDPAGYAALKAKSAPATSTTLG